MRALEATVVRLCASSLALAGVACKPAPRAAPRPPDAGTVVTVYVPAKLADGLMGPLQTVAARHQWALSIRTDSTAILDADLVIVDSAGTRAGRVRAGSPAAVQAQQMADAVFPRVAP